MAIVKNEKADFTVTHGLSQKDILLWQLEPWITAQNGNRYQRFFDVTTVNGTLRITLFEVKIADGERHQVRGKIESLDPRTDSGKVIPRSGILFEGRFDIRTRKGLLFARSN